MPMSKPTIDPALRALLVCPVCRGDLADETSLTGETTLVCLVDRLVFPVVDGVPWLILETARRLDPLA